MARTASRSRNHEDGQGRPVVARPVARPPARRSSQSSQVVSTFFATRAGPSAREFFCTVAMQLPYGALAFVHSTYIRPASAPSSLHPAVLSSPDRWVLLRHASSSGSAGSTRSDIRRAAGALACRHPISRSRRETHPPRRSCSARITRATSIRRPVPHAAPALHILYKPSFTSSRLWELRSMSAALSPSSVTTGSARWSRSAAARTPCAPVIHS
jgi:hypothetical protein